MNHPTDDIYMDRIPEHYSSHNGRPYRDVIYNNINNKNKIAEMNVKKDTSQRKETLKGFKDDFQNYYTNLKNQAEKSQHIGKFKRFISKIKIWFSGICVNRHSLYDDISSNDGEYRDRMQNAPLLLHDHGSNTIKRGNPNFSTPEESPIKREDIWTVESKYIKNRHHRNGTGGVSKATRNRPPTMPKPSFVDSSISIMPNDNYGFFSDKYTDI